MGGGASRDQDRGVRPLVTGAGGREVRPLNTSSRLSLPADVFPPPVASSAPAEQS